MRLFSARSAAVAAFAFVVSACSGADLQQPEFLSERITAPGARSALVVAPGSTAQLRTNLPSGLCWDAGGSTQISLRTCDPRAGFQQFGMQSNGEIRLGNGCLVPWGGSGNNGDPLTVYGCGGATSKWTLTAADEIRSFNDKCLQPVNVGNVGETIVLQPCTGALNQKWSNAAGTTTVPTTPAPTGPVPVASVSISLGSSTLLVGATTSATAVMRDANNNVLTDRMIVFSSSNNAVATVSPTGVVTAVAAGSAAITASFEGKSASATLTVTAPPTNTTTTGSGTGSTFATGVAALMKTALASGLCWDAGSSTQVSLRPCLPGAGYQLFTLQSTGEMRMGGGCLVAWGDAGNNGDPLTVYGCGSASSKWSFTAQQEIRSFNGKCLQPLNVGNAGETIVLQPCTGGANQKWSNVATTVTPAPTPVPPAPVAVASVTMSLGSSSLVVGGTTAATAVMRDANNNVLTDRMVVFSSSNTAVATVSTTGTVAAIAAGSAVITASIEGKSANATLVVTAPPTNTTPTGTTPGNAAGSTFATGVGALMKTALPSALCWDAGSSTQVSLRTCLPTAGYQLVALQSNGEMRLGGGCLMAWGDAGNNGDPLTVYSCGSVSAKWTFTAQQELRSFNGKCLQPASTGAAGERVVLQPCTGATNQKWSNVAGSTTTPTTPTAPAAVASVAVTLASNSLMAGSATQATAVARDASNNVLTGRVVAWASSNTAVATVSATGAVTAVAAGSASISATVEGRMGSTSLTVTAPPVATGPTTGYFVAPNGSAGGDGTFERPWDIATALAHPARVRAGDVIWIRGGTYRGQYTSYLRGEAGRPVTMRQYPGERATIDGGLAVRGAYSWFWGFEVMNSSLGALVTAIDVFGAGTKIINMIVHDAAGNGIGLWEGANDAEVYGNVLYNVGRAGSSAGRYAHGIYFQNVTAGKRLVDNIVLNSYSYNFHGYTENAGLNNLYLEGNVSFNAGSFVTYGGAEFLIGGGQPVKNMTFTGNFSYRGGGMNARNEFGYGAPTPVGNTITNNYLQGSTKVSYFDGGVFTGNTFANRPGSYQLIEFFQNSNQTMGPAFTWSNNTYRAPNANNVAAFRRVSGTGTGYTWAQWQGFGYDANSDFQIAPISGTKVAVRPNQYEPGRANVVVYNWDNQGSVLVNLGSVLAPGDRYEVREVQDYYGAVVASGTYAGGSISLPMAPVTAVRPLGAINSAAPSTGTEFHTFVVLRK